MSAAGFPVYVAKYTLSEELKEKARRLAKQVQSGNIIVITGSNGVEKESFACYFALHVGLNFRGKAVFFVQAPSIETSRIGDEERWGHIVIFALADQVGAKQNRAVFSRITQLVQDGNVPILLASGLHTINKTYGETFVSYYADLIKVISLPKSKEITVEELA